MLNQNVPPPLPFYSATGFDLLSILARVATRPNPQVTLGPVDLNCSFVIVDVRRFDQPIVYSSPSFCALTGYSEAEVIGRNCRFLQAPLGNVCKGERRTHTSNEAVSYMKKNLIANKECQTSVLNYRKGGSSFINLVTVIPLLGGVSGFPHEDDDYIYHVGFQVDLNQRNGVLNEIQPGGYPLDSVSTNANSSSTNNIEEQNHHSATGRERKANSLPPIVMSKELKRLIADPGFVKSIPLSMSTVMPLSSSTSSSHDGLNGNFNHILHLFLLEAAPDFIHVVSLQGDFLYVAPSVRRVLGYEPEEMVGKAISDYAHPEDVIPLKRELKESSATGCTTAVINAISHNNISSAANGKSASGAPRSVNLLFRAQTKMGRFVWMECRGRLHIEPGKGRKAIILSGRARQMMELDMKDVKGAGGLARGVKFSSDGAVKEPAREDSNCGMAEQEVWGMIAGHGRETMTFHSIGKCVDNILGWSSDDLIGRSVADVVLDDGIKHALGGVVANMRAYQQVRSSHHHSVAGVDSAKVKKFRCLLRKKDGGVADVWFIVYRVESNEDMEEESCEEGALQDFSSISPTPLVFQIRLVEAETLIPRSDPAVAMFPLQPIPHSTSVNSTDSITSSSLAGAVSIPHVISFSLLPASLSFKSSVSVGMFEELAISRGSSWQYELQQLRFANVRLREELLAFESAKVESKSVNDAGVAVSQEREPVSVSSTAQPQAQARTGVSKPAGFPLSSSPPLIMGCDSLPHGTDNLCSDLSFITESTLFGQQCYYQPTTMVPHPSVFSVDVIRNNATVMSQPPPSPSTTHFVHSQLLVSSHTPHYDWCRTVPVYTSADFDVDGQRKGSLKRRWNPTG